VSEHTHPQESGETLSRDDIQAVQQLQQAYHTLRQELAKTIVGQDEVLEQLLMCIFARGHAILEGVPGLAKTLMISALARCLRLTFARIQFTPDLMPSDITGTEVIQEDKATGSRQFKFLEGPLFANLILADEINRPPPKTQAALLEAMQERQVSAGGKRYPMFDPFFVLATQNPIEQEGTYPLPEAQQDRFMFKVYVKYPSFTEEFEVARRTTTTQTDTIQPVLTAAQIVELQHVVREVPVSDHVIRYTLALVRQTRVGEPGVPDFVQDQIRWGAGPRAVQFMVLGAKAPALLQGRTHVTCEDIRALAKPVLRHRLVLSFTAESEGLVDDDLVDRLVAATPDREDELTANARFQKILAS